MGGHAWVMSEAGRGSIFHFTIRVKSFSSGYSSPLENPPAILQNKRVLIVEDNTTNQRILVYWLKKYGMWPIAVAGHKEALGMLERGEKFDAVILDFQLPVIDGLTLAEKIRTIAGGEALRLLLLTSMHLRAKDPRAAAAGVSVFVYKPIRPRQVLAALRQSFDQRVNSPEKSAAAQVVDSSFAVRFPLRILMADDNRINQKVGSSFLEKLGYWPDVVSNGVEVLQAFARRPYDVILLDVQMPQMDGYETARQLHLHWKGENRPRIIGMTGNAMQGDREKCLEAGMDDYIAKPVRIEDLKIVLGKWRGNLDPNCSTENNVTPDGPQIP
jgi:CheY-like chemotaxis protein